MQTLILAPQTGVFSGQIRTGRRDRRLRIWGRGDPAPTPSSLFRQARSLEEAIPLNGRPLLASSPTASRLNSSVYWRRNVPIKHLPAQSSLPEVSTISREDQPSPAAASASHLQSL